MDATKILSDAIKTIGRTMPVRMEISFWRDIDQPGASMQIINPDGTCVEYLFKNSEPLPIFPLATLLRETQLEKALRDLLASIELHTDCMTGEIDSAALAIEVEASESLLKDLTAEVA